MLIGFLRGFSNVKTLAGRMTADYNMVVCPNRGTFSFSFPFVASSVRWTPPKNHALNSSACHQRKEAVVRSKQEAGILVMPSSHGRAQEKLSQHRACARSYQNCDPGGRNLQA